MLPGEDHTVLSGGFPKFGFVMLGCSCRHTASNIHLTRASAGKNFTIFGCRWLVALQHVIDEIYLHLHEKETACSQDQICTHPLCKSFVLQAMAP